VRRPVLILLAYLFILPLRSVAQDAVGGFTTLPLAAGLAITLPQSWRPVDAAMEMQVRATIDPSFPR
jgi:hypothetical protein